MAAAEAKNNALLAVSQNLAAAVAGVSPRIVAIDARPRVRTSGVIWRDNLIVSTNHTIRRNEEITVTFDDGRELPATIVGRDASTDLAVLRWTGERHAEPAIVTSDAAASPVGSLALAVGRIAAEQGITASLGVISSRGGKWRTWRGGEIDHFIRPDLSIFIGFSGGALIDPAGGVIGINTTGLARGAGLTVPAETVNRVVDALVARGRVARPYLGVGMQQVALPAAWQSKLSVASASGLMILSVEADAPAGKAGVLLGDVLVALDDVAVAATEDVQQVLSGKEIGSVVKATVLRGGEVRNLDVTLGERPARSR